MKMSKSAIKAIKIRSWKALKNFYKRKLAQLNISQKPPVEMDIFHSISALNMIKMPCDSLEMDAPSLQLTNQSSMASLPSYLTIA